MYITQIHPVFLRVFFPGEMAPTDDNLKKLGLKNVKTTGRRLAARPIGPRAVDREAGIRTRPMKLIVASVSRSGTMCKHGPIVA